MVLYELKVNSDRPRGSVDPALCEVEGGLLSCLKSVYKKLMKSYGFPDHKAPEAKVVLGSGGSVLYDMSDSVCEIDGCLYVRIAASESTHSKLAYLLSRCVRCIDSDGAYWKMSFSLVEDKDDVNQKFHENSSGGGRPKHWHRIVWHDRSLAGDFYANNSLPPAVTLQERQIEIFDGSDMADAMKARMKPASGDPECSLEELNAAIRARMLVFDSAETGKTMRGRTSVFKTHEHQDRALVALCRRMKQWPYCHRVLINSENFETLGYVSAGPLARPSKKVHAGFVEHGDNLTVSEIDWHAVAVGEPVKKELMEGKVLFFSGFRIALKYKNCRVLHKKLLQASLDVVKSFYDHVGEYENIWISLSQPAARQEILDVYGSRVGVRYPEQQHFCELALSDLGKMIAAADEAVGEASN